MTWDKLKSFLIGLFILINIFLIICTVNINNSYKLSDEAIDSACGLLLKNSITIDKNIVLKEAIDFGYEEFKPKTAKDMSIITEYTENPDGSYTFSIKRGNFYNIKPKKLLEDIGFSKNSINIISDKYKKGVRYINASQKYNGKTIFTSYINAKITKNGLAEITFKWYNITDGHNTELVNSEPVFASSALIDFISLNARHPSSNNITKIETGYYIPTVTEQNQVQTITAIPVYCIKCDDSSSYYYNAYDGSFIQ